MARASLTEHIQPRVLDGENHATLKLKHSDRTDVLKTVRAYTTDWLYRKDVKWGNTFWILSFTFVAIYTTLAFPYIQKWKTFLLVVLWIRMGAFGVAGGVHRYWSHRSYKANVPLRIILAICYISAGQNSIKQWVRDHRVHHKYSETDADPHNSNRGFFFSHMGWLMVKKHPDVLSKGNTIDMSDINDDPVAAFCNRHYGFLKLMLCFVIPITLPVYLWNEEWKWAALAQISRYMYVLHGTWTVNSIAHIWGNKPYDRNIAPVENPFVSYITFGEGWHNYHHSFPSDYRAAEIGGGRFNSTAVIIDFFAKIGWAWDLKEPSKELVNTTVANRGDETLRTR